MRYILNNEGYIYDVSFGAIIECSLGTCTEYKGKVPNGYSTIEDWHAGEIERLNAWKIVDGNLVFDANRDYKLKILHDEEAYANGYVTRREMGITSTDEVNPYAELYSSKDAFSKGFIARTNEDAIKTGNIPVVEVQLQPYVFEGQKPEILEVEFIGNNFLPNTATSTFNNGISYVQNIDKTITVTGSATAKSTLNLAGTDTSVRNILTFKGDYKVNYGDGIATEHNSYHLSGLAEGVNLELYHYDGTDRTLIGIYKNNDIITFANEVNVTQVVLTIDSGTTINTTLKPMLRFIDGKYPILPMTKYKGNLFDKDTTEYEMYASFDLNTGEKISSADSRWGITKTYIPTFGTKDLVISGKIVPTWWEIYVVLYDENKQIIKAMTVQNHSSRLDTYTINSDVPIHYIRFTVFSDNYDSNSIQIESGTTVSEYKSYNGRDGQYYVDGVSTQVTRSGKNLLNTPYTVDNKLTKTATKDDDFTILDYYVTLQVGKTYTFSFETDGILGSEHASDTVEIFLLKDKNYTSMVGLSFNPMTFTVSETGNYYLRYDINQNGKTHSFWNFYVAEESSFSGFEQYGVSPSPNYPSEIVNIYKAGTYNAIADDKVYTITLEEDLRGLPNGVGDRLWINSSNVVDIERKIGKVILKGSETWYLVAGNNNYYTVALNNIKQTMTEQGDNGVLSNHFKGTFITGTTTSNGIATITNAIRIRYSNITTVDEFKTWLSTHNTEVYYELATYTTSSIGEVNGVTSEYEEYKNNTTLIDMKGYSVGAYDVILIKDNQAYIKRNGYYTEEQLETQKLDYEYILLGNVSMPRAYTPYTYAYCHQKFEVRFVYKDPRNIDVTKITLKGLLSITNIESEYDFTLEDAQKVTSYANGETVLTDEELELYDVNGDGIVDKLDTLAIQRMYYGYIPNTVKGTFEINTTKSQRVLVLRDEEGKILTSMGLNGMTTPSLSIDGGKVYGEHVLFEGAENGNITLKDDVSNYDYIEIFYRDQAQYTSLKIHNPNGTYANLNIIDYDAGTNGVWDKFKKVLINGTTISNEWCGEISLHSSNVTANVNTIYITKVVGYRDERIEKIEQPDEPIEPEQPTDPIVPVENSKTISANGSKAHHKFTLEVNEESISGTKSSLNYSFKLSPIIKEYDWANWTNASRTVSYTITIGDYTHNGMIPAYDGNSIVTIKSESNIEIEHNADGTKTIPISFRVTDTTGASFTSGNANASAEMVLTKIQ